MATLLRMPEVAAGATEAVLTEWLVQVDTAVTAGTPVALVETDKASVEIAAETDTVILRTLVAGGTVVEVGAPVALLGADGEVSADADRMLAELGVGQAPEPDHDPAQAPDPAPQPTGEGGRIFVSPLSRKMLKEAGMRPEDVRGTGPNGRIVRRDVDAAIAVRAAAAPQPEPQPAVESPAPVADAPSRPAPPARPAPVRTAVDGFEDVPHSRLRRLIAQRLTGSKQAIPHFYLRRSATLDAMLELRSRLNEVSPTRISVNDLVVRAVAVAHRAVPEMNVVWTDEALRRFDSVDIGVAIAGERGLVTPVLRGVGTTSPGAIAAHVRRYARQAADGTLRQGDLEGGSITVTNLGMFGIDEFSAIINPPQSAILAVGAGRRTPVVVDDELQVATTMALVLSVDHRAIDGALAARWMEVLVQAIEQPLRLVA